MKIKINEQIFAKYPALMVGVIYVKNANNQGSSEEVTALLQAVQQRAAARIGERRVSEIPEVQAWREAYRQFGVKAAKYPPSIERLLKRIQSGEQLREINKLVDLYNVISLKYFLPVGGEDLDQVEGDIELTVASDSEPAVRMLGEKEAKAPHSGEVIYKDDVGAMCRRFNWKEAERTKLTEETRRAVLVLEALPPISEEQLRAAVGELSALVREHLKAEVETTVLNREKMQEMLK